MTFLHPTNAAEPNVVIVEGNRVEASATRLEHSANALSPIKLILDEARSNVVNFLHPMYLQPIITQYFIDNKSEIWLLFLIAHSKR